jgi:hypothetical protein
MKIKWKNIAILLLVLLVLFIWIRAGPQILEFLSTIPKVEATGDRNDRMFGLMGFGLICVTLTAIVKILTNRQ